MFEKEIQTAKQQLSSHLLTGDTYVYLQDILNNPEVHSFYKGFFRGEVDWWIYEQKMLREANPRFDFGNEEFLGIQQEYDQYCRQTARFDHVELTSMIDLAAKTRVNYLLRPRTTLKWFVYRGEPTKPLHEVLLRFAYFDCYNYLLEEFGKWAAGKVSESSHQDILSVIEFERLIENIDNDIILEHTTSEFAELLSPLYEFFYEVQPEGQRAIPTPALIIFLDDKGILRISQELERLMKEEDLDVITRQEFLNVIDKVILQVEDETGVQQTFVDDSTIPLDFDHNSRRPTTPVQATPPPVELPKIAGFDFDKEILSAAEKIQEMEPLPPVVEMNEQIDGVETVTDKSEPSETVLPESEQISDTPISDAESPQLQEPSPESGMESEPESADTFADASIADTETLQLEEPSPESETVSEPEVAESSAEKRAEKPVETGADSSEATETASVNEEVVSPMVEEESLSEKETLPAEPETIEEEPFVIVDVAGEEEPSVSDSAEMEESEEISLSESTDSALADETIQDITTGASEEEIESHSTGDTGDIQSIEAEPDDAQPEFEEPTDERETHDEQELESGDKSIPSTLAAPETEVDDTENEESTLPDTGEDVLSDENSVQIVTDFPDENPDEYELYESEKSDSETVYYTPEKERIGIWNTFEEELQQQNRSEEELYSALFPDTTVQSDDVPSVDAGQYEPDVTDQEEVLLEKTDSGTSGTSVQHGVYYSAIEELLDDNLRQRVVKHIFHRNEERFQAILQRLNATQSWREASSIIDRVFSEHEVDPYSSIAKKFSDIVYERFLTGQ